MFSVRVFCPSFLVFTCLFNTYSFDQFGSLNAELSCSCRAWAWPNANGMELQFDRCNDQIVKITRAAHIEILYFALRCKSVLLSIAASLQLQTPDQGHTYRESIEYLRLRLRFAVLRVCLISLRGTRTKVQHTPIGLIDLNLL